MMKIITIILLAFSLLLCNGRGHQIEHAGIKQKIKKYIRIKYASPNQDKPFPIILISNYKINIGSNFEDAFTTCVQVSDSIYSCANNFVINNRTKPFKIESWDDWGISMFENDSLIVEYFTNASQSGKYFYDLNESINKCGKNKDLSDALTLLMRRSGYYLNQKK